MGDVNSMTGFGAAQGEGEGLDVRVELKSVNARFLKVSLRTSSVLSPQESSLEALIKKHLKRGSVHASIHARPADATARVPVDEELVKAYQEVFRRLGLEETTIPTLPGVLSNVDRDLNDGQRAHVESVVGRALEALLSMRLREGEALTGVVGDLFDRIDALRKRLAEHTGDVVKEYQTKLTDRVSTLLEGSGVEVDPQIIAREVALFADRCDITEELERLGAHVTHGRELLQKGGEIGRSLDFLAQELLREANTVGSKSSDVDIGRVVVELKTEIERVKEQVANIE